MSLADRLKQIRNSLGYTQKDAAKSVSVSVQMWQAYEAGRSVPGGNVLEALARLGFNVNWLLTGLGHMHMVTAGDVWSEKFRELRGNLTIPEFVQKLKFNDPENEIATIQAIENKNLDPDFGLLTVIVDELGISLDWFLGWHDAPKIRKGSPLNLVLLKDIIKEAYLYESINPGSLSPEKKAELIAELYAMRTTNDKG
jgi:transcriptional regulator with XRE-family HTH domain